MLSPFEDAGNPFIQSVIYSLSTELSSYLSINLLALNTINNFYIQKSQAYYWNISLFREKGLLRKNTHLGYPKDKFPPFSSFSLFPSLFQ